LRNWVLSQLERHPGFPGGTNVEFVVVKQGKVQVKVWERGAGVTPACGLGACAVSSWIDYLQLIPEKEIPVHMQGEPF